MGIKYYFRKKSRNIFFRILNPVAIYLDLTLISLTQVEKLEVLIKSLRPVDPGNELIRVGPKHDGGYLIPNDLEGIAALFSPGVDFESGFEMDLATKGLKVFLADYSVERPVVNHENFRFVKKYLGSFNSETFFTLDSWIHHSGIDDKSDLMLQMDIEGFELEALFSLSDENLERFRIIIIEFHDLNRLIEPFFFKQFSRVIGKLLKHHTVVHLHPNNNAKILRLRNLEIPKVMEFTFYRNDRVKSDKLRRDFPHPLDFNNKIEKPSLPLPKSWYCSK